MAGSRRIDFPYHPPHLVETDSIHCFAVKWRRTRQQFVQQDSQRINVAARVDIQRVHLRLLRTHVQRCADHLCETCVERLLGQFLMDGLGDPKIYHFHDGLVVVQRNQHIGRLDVAVDDSFVMRVLNGLADIDEQFQSLRCGQPIIVTEFGDRDAPHQFHHEVRSSRFRGPAIVHLGNVGMIHQGQRLTLCVKACEHLLGIHPWLDDLQRHLAADGLGLFGHVDHTHAPFADLLQ